MLNLLLIFLMIAALAGIVFCNQRRQHQLNRRAANQVIALLLLVLVLVSGGLFVSRTGAVRMLSGERSNLADTPEYETQLFASQGTALGTFINAQYPGQKTVLVNAMVSPVMSTPLIESLRISCKNPLTVLDLRKGSQLAVSAPSAVDDDMILPDVSTSELSGIEQINQLLRSHSDNSVVILLCSSAEAEDMHYLELFKLPASRRPALLISGINNLNDFFYERISKHFIDAMIVRDFVRSSRAQQEVATTENADTLHNPMEIFQQNYVLITPDNLKNNRRFFL